MRTRLAFLLIAASLFVSTSSAVAQPPWAKGGSTRGGFFSDPNATFDRLAGERSFILVSEVSSFMREPLSEWAKEKGIKDGKLTREQLSEAWPSVTEAIRARVRGGSGDTSAAASSGSGDTTDIKKLAEADFKRRDQNSDGLLNTDEMPYSLRSDLARWDKNRDKLIDLREYIAYFEARTERNRSRETSQPALEVAVIVIIEDDLDSRPEVYRAGKLPKDMPSWFQELDIDNDGQVSFYEWRQARKSLDEFLAYDHNNDGFIIPEEVLRYQANGESNTKTASTASTGDGAGSSSNNASSGSGSGTRPSFFGGGSGGTPGRFGGGTRPTGGFRGR